MEEEEIELWYAEQKQKLSEAYIKAINRGVSLEKREKRFTREFEKLQKKYERKFRAYLKHQDAMKRKVVTRRKQKEPFIKIGKAITGTFRFFSGGITKGLKMMASSTRFSMKMMWMKNGHKFIDGTQNLIRPSYFFYAKHMKYPLIILTKPLVIFGRWIKNLFEVTKQGIKNGAKAAWKGIVKAFKWSVKHGGAVSKVVSAKLESWGKVYNDWQAKRIQAALDKKAAKEDAKKKRQEEKEAKKKAKEEGEEERNNKGNKEGEEEGDKEGEEEGDKEGEKEGKVDIKGGDEETKGENEDDKKADEKADEGE